jgi:hypothetical protein
MKTITYEFMNNVLYTGTFLISSQAYELVKDKLDWEVWKQDSFNNYNVGDKKYYIKVPYGYKKSYTSVIIEQISLLKQEGFDLSPKAQNQFDYWNGIYKDALEKEEKRLKELKEKELAKQQEQAKHDYILWCGKYDCRTTRTFCNNCERGYRMGCKPALMKVKTI